MIAKASYSINSQESIGINDPPTSINADENVQPSDQSNQNEESDVSDVIESSHKTIFNDPLNFNIKHPLQGSWTFWYDSQSNKPAQKEWTSNLKPLITFDTVEDFWGSYNNISKAKELSTGSNFHVFRDGINPAWEDPANEHGGRWTAQITKQKAGKINDYWLYSILFCIGEASLGSEEICGVVVSLRRNFYRLSLWTRNSTDREILKEIGQAFRNATEFPKEISLEFQPHSDATKTDVDRQERLFV